MRVLFRRQLGGEKWTIYEVAPGNKNLLADGDRCNGRCCPDECKIYVNRDLEPSAKAHTILHELVHALLHVTGADKAYDMDHEKEENLVSAFTPALHRLLDDCGFNIAGLYT